MNNFEFARKTFVATDDSSLGNNAKDMDLDFKLTLIAEPGFTGDVTLTLGGDAFDKEQTVKIAKFVSPYTIEAQQNDPDHRLQKHKGSYKRSNQRSRSWSVEER